MGNRNSKKNKGAATAQDTKAQAPSKTTSTATASATSNATTTAPAAKAAAPAATGSDDVKQSEALSLGMKIIEQGFVKIDHFENIYRLEPKVDGAPNFRQCQGFHIFGTGQPTITAHKTLFKAFQDLELSRVLWFNMRSEPVIYVNDMSYGPREPSHPSENIHLPRDITIEEVNALSDALAQVVRKNAESNKNVFVYHKDSYALLPEDRIDQTKEEPLDADNFRPPVKPLLELYDLTLPMWLEMESKASEANEANGSGGSFGVRCERLPVNDERAPDANDVDRLVSIMLKHSDATTAVVFNCQMGKGRTTEGMIMACIIKKNMGQHDEGLLQQMASKLDTLGKKLFWPSERPEVSAEASKDNKKFAEVETIKEIIDKEGEKSYNGEYSIVMKLIGLLKEKYALDAEAIKQETDDIIDRCQHLQNLRNCIFSTKLRYEYEISQGKENSKERADYWKRLSLNYLERYYVLICFNAYVHDVMAKGGVEQLAKINYSEWMQERSDIGDTLGTYTQGPLSQFNWD